LSAGKVGDAYPWRTITKAWCGRPQARQFAFNTPVKNSVEKIYMPKLLVKEPHPAPVAGRHKRMLRCHARLLPAGIIEFLSTRFRFFP
jgi:hypothetical protein